MKLVAIILSLCLLAGVGHGVWLYLRSPAAVAVPSSALATERADMGSSE